MFYPKDDDPDVIERFRARRKRAERQKMVKPLLICAGIGLIILLFCLRPSPILGMDGRSLQYSFDKSSVVSGTADMCKSRKGKGQWTCYFYDDSNDREIPYKVSVDRLGCWTGTTSAKKEGKGPAIESERTGCVTILGHIRVLNVFG